MLVLGYLSILIISSLCAYKDVSTLTCCWSNSCMICLQYARVSLSTPGSDIWQPPWLSSMVYVRLQLLSLSFMCCLYNCYSVGLATLTPQRSNEIHATTVAKLVTEQLIVPSNRGRNPAIFAAILDMRAMTAHRHVPLTGTSVIAM